MALGDGIRRNIASVDPMERALLRDAMLELNRRFFPGNRTDPIPGGVSLWFKQDEIHQATHVHNGPEFLPWHRELVNRFEEMLRQVNPLLSLHYWDWTQDPRSIPNANLGGGLTGVLNLFTPDFMGYGGSTPQPLGQPLGPPWQNATAPWRRDGFYVPGASPDRDSTENPADPPASVNRLVDGSPALAADDTAIVNAGDYAEMRDLLEDVHDRMHGFVKMGGQHISFHDPFVFLLHSNVDRLFARWQTDPNHPERLHGDTVYGTESDLDVKVEDTIQNVNNYVEPWSTGRAVDQFGLEHFVRPWSAPESNGIPKTYKHPSVVTPPRYDTNNRTSTFTTDAAPAVAGVGDNVYFFAKHPDGRIFFNRAKLGEGGVGWTEIEGDGRTDAAPAAGAVGTHVFVAVKGPDGQLYLNQADLGQPFGEWFPMDFITDAAPAVAGVGDNVYFFAKHPDGRIFFNRAKLGEGGVGWSEVQGDGRTDAAPVAGAVGTHVFVAVKGPDGQLYLNQADLGQPFGEWFPMDFTTDVAPAVTGVGDNVYFFAKHSDGRIFFNRAKLGEGGVGWSEVQGDGRTDAAPAAGAVGTHVFVAVKGPDGQLYLNQADLGQPFGEWFPS